MIATGVAWLVSVCSARGCSLHRSSAMLFLFRGWRRSVCVPLVLEVGVQVRVDEWDRHYVRAKDLK